MLWTVFKRTHAWVGRGEWVAVIVSCQPADRYTGMDRRASRQKREVEGRVLKIFVIQRRGRRKFSSQRGIYT